MRYASIRKMDISNGEGLGVSLFVQGCPLHCYNCFNQELWDFNSGYEWTTKIQKDFLYLISNPHVKRVSILGGEPLAEQNRIQIDELLSVMRKQYPNIRIWLYSGYCFENLLMEQYDYKSLLNKCDVLVDGPYLDGQKDLTLEFRGSSNQRVINVQESLKQNQVVLWNLTTTN